MLLPWEPVRKQLVELKERGFTILPEHKFGVDRYYRKVDFFKAPDLWVRVGLDVFADFGDRIKIADYKTGRYKTEHKEDAMFYGAAVQHCYQKPVEVDYFYIDAPEMSFSRPVVDGHKVLGSWMNKFNHADGLIEAGLFNLVTGPQCKWCGFKECPNNSNEKL